MSGSARDLIRRAAIRQNAQLRDGLRVKPRDVGEWGAGRIRRLPETRPTSPARREKV